MVGHEPAAGKSCEWPELSRISFLSFSPLPFFSSSFSSFLFFRFERRKESCSKNKRPCSFFFFFLLSLIFGLRCILSLETNYVRLFLKMFDSYHRVYLKASFDQVYRKAGKVYKLSAGCCRLVEHVESVVSDRVAVPPAEVWLHPTERPPRGMGLVSPPSIPANLTIPLFSTSVRKQLFLPFCKNLQNSEDQKIQSIERLIKKKCNWKRMISTDVFLIKYLTIRCYQSLE